MAFNLLSYTEICQKADIFFNEEEATLAQKRGEQFLLWWQRLAYQALQDGVCAYKVRPKTHYFAHTILDIKDTYENPAKQALWGAEDLVGQIKRVGQKCSKRTISNRVPQRRGLHLFMRARYARWRVPRKTTTLKTQVRNCPQ